MDKSHEAVTGHDPRQDMFMVPTDLLSKDQMLGLIEEYCTRYHGLNDQENPLAQTDSVQTAVRKGELVVWFDPVSNSASLGAPHKQH